jgi:hypothetical protein
MDISIIFISLCIGFLMGYFTSYFKEKGKNQAIIEDIEIMTDKKEKVSSHYKLDVTKRTFKYEDKRAMYFKYFNLLDELQTEGNKIAQVEVLPAINKFMEAHLNANGNTSRVFKAINDLTKSVNNAMLKMHESQMKLKQETNSIRLVAGESILDTLKEMEIHYNFQLEKTGKMMKDLAKNVVDKNQYILKAQQIENEEISKKSQILKDKIINSMKRELDEI